MRIIERFDTDSTILLAVTGHRILHRFRKIWTTRVEFFYLFFTAAMELNRLN